MCIVQYSVFSSVLKFGLVNFRAFSEVPLPLVMTIAASYESRREVCRKCFFGERSLCGEESGVCEECGQPWENPVTVIPGLTSVVCIHVCTLYTMHSVSLV